MKSHIIPITTFFDVAAFKATVKISSGSNSNILYDLPCFRKHKLAFYTYKWHSPSSIEDKTVFLGGTYSIEDKTRFVGGAFPNARGALYTLHNEEFLYR